MTIPPGSDVCTRVWLRQTCVACGAVYSFFNGWRARDGVMGPGATVEGARALHVSHSEAGATQPPCPNCGWVQPSQFAAAASDGVMVTMSLVPVCGLILAAVGLFGVAKPVAAGVIAAILVAAGLYHAIRSLRGPNTNPRGNLAAFTPNSSVGSGQVERPGGEPSVPDYERRFRQRIWSVWLGMLIAVGVAVVSLAVPAAFWYAEVAAVVLFFWFGRELYFRQWAIAEDYPKAVVVHAESQVVKSGSPSPDQWQGRRGARPVAEGDDDIPVAQPVRPAAPRQPRATTRGPVWKVTGTDPGTGSVVEREVAAGSREEAVAAAVLDGLEVESAERLGDPIEHSPGPHVPYCERCGDPLRLSEVDCGSCGAARR